MVLMPASATELETTSNSSGTPVRPDSFLRVMKQRRISVHLGLLRFGSKHTDKVSEP